MDSDKIIEMKKQSKDYAKGFDDGVFQLMELMTAIFENNNAMRNIAYKKGQEAVYNLPPDKQARLRKAFDEIDEILGEAYDEFMRENEQGRVQKVLRAVARKMQGADGAGQGDDKRRG